MSESPRITSLQFHGRGELTGIAFAEWTFDQVGNVWEWTEELLLGYARIRGGDDLNAPITLSATHSASTANAADEDPRIGIRVVPEPARMLQLAAAIALLLVTRWRTAR